MFDDLTTLARNLSPTHSLTSIPDYFWLFYGVILSFLYMLARRGRRGARGDAWRKRMEDMRDRADRNEAEQRAFREQTLTELRRLTALSEKQNALLTQLLGERGGADEVVGEGTEASADAAEATEPANEI